VGRTNRRNSSGPAGRQKGSQERARLKKRIRTIVTRLERCHGPRRWRRREDAVATLVGTILSQNTSDTNSGAAFEELTRRFRSWEDLLNAPVPKIAEAIHSGGLAQQKARTIKGALQQIQRDFGRVTLRPLARWDDQRAMHYLTGIAGVGPKTAACVLLFAFGRSVFPVDTHIHRLGRRLGLVPENFSAVRTQQVLQEACPAELVYPFHVLMITHGRRVCRAQRPACGDCVLNDLCPSAGKLGR